MFKQIMLPLDGSYCSETVLPLAMQLARVCGARLHLVRVHVAEQTTSEDIVMTNVGELQRKWERDALAGLESRARGEGVEVSAELLEGPIVAGLRNYAAAAGIDLVVMATHGRRGLARTIMGSIAEQLVRSTRLPILLLRPTSYTDLVVTGIADIRRILVALDGSDEAASILPYAADFARLAGAEIVLARIAVTPYEITAAAGVNAVADDNVRIRGQAHAYLERIGRTVASGTPIRPVVVAGSHVPTAILKCAAVQRADLIALTTHGPTGWRRVAVGSVAENVLRRATVPVLVLNTPASGSVA